MDYLSTIKAPIESDLQEFIRLFNDDLTHEHGLLNQALQHIRNRAGKRMRPMLILLIAKAFGEVNDSTQRAAVGLELIHTASLVHDDVVDESAIRRGQASVNACFDNKVAVLVGDFIVSTALQSVSKTRNYRIIDFLAELGRTLSNGEILQLSNIQNQAISEDVYYDVIKQKTAALFEACAAIGALSSGATEEQLQEAKMFGRNLGIAFQIRDDIFDYYDQGEIGKPTGNDMAEGKLTLPVIYAVNSTQNEEFLSIARKVKQGNISKVEINRLVEFTKQNGGIEYAEKRMNEFRDLALDFIHKNVNKTDVANSLKTYVDFVVDRSV